MVVMVWESLSAICSKCSRLCITALDFAKYMFVEILVDL